MTRKSELSRRDFLNGILLASGGAAVASSVPLRAFASTVSGPIGSDPRALRGGNLPATFNIAHWMRDKRLTFGAGTVTVAPGKFDSFSGTFPIADDGEANDVVIVGAGISGLSAAYYLRQQKPDAKVLLLETNPTFGGNAGRDDASPELPVIAGTGGAYHVAPYADFLTDIYAGVGIDWEKWQIQGPFYNYFFDEHTPGALPGKKGWVLDTYGKGLKDMPYPKKVLDDIKKSAKDFAAWYNTVGGPTDPADSSDPKFDALAQMTLADYFAAKGWHPTLNDYYTAYAVDALAGTTSQVNAFTSISFLGAEFNPVFALPGGTSGFARHLVKWLIPSALDGKDTEQLVVSAIHTSELDKPGQAIRIRTSAIAVRADTGATSASVVYWKDGQFRRATAKTVIHAGQSHTARHVVEHLAEPARVQAWGKFTQVPVVTANVQLKSAAVLHDLGLGYDQYWWGSQYWADFVVADWTTAQHTVRNRPTSLTFFGGNWAPPDEMPQERLKLLTTPFSSYEDSLRADMARILGPYGFDFDRDVSSVYVYRWGHGMIHPSLGFPFGPPQNKNGQVVRTPSPRHVARAPLGRIHFAGQDVESSPAIESAIGSGLRTAQEVVGLL